MLRFIHFITLMLLSLIVSLASAQSAEKPKINISGTINNKSSEIMIHLKASETQTLVKTEYADDNGNFLFSDIPAGNYFVAFEQNGKTVYTGKTFEANANVYLKNIEYTPETQLLSEVTVTKNKQFIERQDGKMILNIENSIAATGSSAFEILEKAPGVKVDNNDNISLRGKSGLIIQIDGKPTPMSGNNLANYLRGIASGAVEKIEFITNPSSKYDAAGSSIINIKMKKDKRKGTNGSISSSYGQGKYAKTNHNASLNHRNKKINAFGNYSFSYREGFSELLLKRDFYENGSFSGAYDQDNYLNITFKNHIARAGLDYFVNDKHTIGLLVSGVNNRFNPDGQNYSDVYDGSHAKISRFETRSRSKENWKNAAVNLNYKYVIDTVGTELTADFDYANYGSKTNQLFNTSYLNVDGSALSPDYKLFGNLKGGLDIYAVKSDFMTQLKNNIRLETGLKTSFVKADNNLAFYDRSSGSDVFDPTKSNHFIYEENINAAYVNLSKAVGKWNFQLGLRLENTNIKGKQLVDNTAFDDHYSQLFPSGLASYAANPNNTFEFNYSRRIQRPGYDQLNPFKYYLDPTTYKAGNPYLKPQITHSIEFTHVLKQKIYTTLSFARTLDNITETISPSDLDPKITVQTNKNLKSVDIYGLYFIVPHSITKWWDSTNNLNFYVGSYSGTIANTTLSNSGNFTWNINSQHNFKLGNGFFAELSGDYRAREAYAFDVIKPYWFMNSGLQKKFKNKSTLKLAVTDIFNTNNIKARVRFTGYEENFHVTRDSRVVTLSYTYNFGNSNGMSQRKTGGADDIKQRAAKNG